MAHLVARAARALSAIMGVVDRVPRAGQVAIVLSLHASLSMVAAVGDAAVFDENFHLASGYTYLDRGDFRISPEAPPLVRMWAALPLWLQGLDDVDYSSDTWKSSERWAYGYEFVFGPMHEDRRRNVRERLLPGRAMMVLLGCLLGLVIYAWSREMWGHRGALASLVLFALSPLMLAHDHLVTVDAGAGLGFALTGWLYWRWCRAPSVMRALLAGAALGAALLTKMTAILLGPILLAVTLLWIVRRARWVGWGSRVPPSLAHVLLVGAVAYAVVWAGYRFRFRTSPDPSYVASVRDLPVVRPALRWALTLADRHRLLPESYVYGLGTLDRRDEHFMYLNGTATWDKSWSMWYFFPEVVLLKSTPAELAVMAWLVVVAWRRRRTRSFSWWYMTVAIVLFFATAVLSRIYMGQRHLLPMYALLFVFAGALVRLYARRERGRLLLAGILVSHLVSSFSACPRYLAYFNVIGGPPERASRYLLDSNLDWGQDLSRLPAAMEELGIAEVYLVYCGTADPRAYGVRYRKAAEWSRRLGSREAVETPPAGAYVAISLMELRCSTDPLPRKLSTMAPIGRAGDSIFIYRMP